MSFGVPQQRPGALDLITIVSFIMSVLNVIWAIVLGVIVLVLGAASWLAGPAVGAVGTTVSAVVVLILIIQSFLSLLLFAAAWNTWRGNPSGRTLHLIWAWIILVIDLIDLAFTGGMDPGAWVRLIYAVIVLYVMNRPEVQAYFQRQEAY